MKYSELLKAKGFGVVKSSFPLYEKPDPNKENEWIISDDELMALQNQKILWIAEARYEWIASKNAYEKYKDKFLEDEWICEFCKEKNKEMGVEWGFCPHSDAFRKLRAGEFG